MYKKILALILSYVIISTIGVSCVVSAEDGTVPDDDFSNRGTGAIKKTDEQLQNFMERTPEIVGVNYNQIALERIYGNDYVSGASLDANAKDVITSWDTVEEQISVASDEQLPSAVDNSASDRFPVIGDQGRSNSCVAWSFGYYQMTNNIAVARGHSVKSGSTNVNKNYVISPKWLYNLINDGQNVPTSEEYAMEVACCYGGASWADCYGETTANYGNYATWNPGTEIWRNAINNKMNKGSYLDLYDYNSEKIKLLKKLLINGYVVSFITDSPEDGGLNNWHTMNCTVGSNSSSEKACYYVSESTASHAMTVVGYDDSVWADVNKNGIKDNGEEGAFKIANSWGSSWMNNGYIWLLYDALNDANVDNAASQSNRVNAFQANLVYYLEPIKSYTPLVTAEVELSTSARSQLGIEIGLSSTEKTEPDILRSIAEDYKYEYESRVPEDNTHAIAFNFHKCGDVNCHTCGVVNFTGGSSDGSGEFTFDLTPLFAQYLQENSSKWNSGENARLYFKIIDDNADNKQVKLTSFKIVDNTGGITSVSSTSLPITADGNSQTAYADIKIVPDVVAKDKVFTANFNYPIQSSSVNTSNFYIKDNTNEDVDIRLEQSADRKSVTIKKSGTDEAASNNAKFNRGEYYTLYINTNILTDGGNGLSKPEERLFYIP